MKGLMVALVCLSTMIIQIPIPITNGYINIGDSIIFIASILFGPITGMTGGGLGSALADILSGYSHWALFTLIIKGLEGYIVGIIVIKNTSLLKNIFSTLIGVFIMISGYLLGGTILQGSFLASLSSIPSNLTQGIICVLISIPISSYLLNIRYIKSLKNNQ